MDWRPRSILRRKAGRSASSSATAVAGGAVQTREATLPGFRHDLFAMNLSLFAGSPFRRRLWRGACAPRPRLRASDAIHSPPHFPTGAGSASAPISRRRSPASANCPKRTASVGARWPRLLRATRRIFSPFSAPSCLRSRSSRVLFKAWRAKGFGWLLDTLNLAVSSPREFLDRNFQSDKLKADVAAWGMHLDFSPDVAGGALFPYLEAMANQSFGMAIGKGGADTMIRAMLGLLGELGGEVTSERRGCAHRCGQRPRERRDACRRARLCGEQSRHRQRRSGACLRQASARRQRPTGGRSAHARLSSGPGHDDGASGAR